MSEFSEGFRKYLREEFYPAQRFARSKTGRRWIDKHIPELGRLIDSRYDEVAFGVYILTFGTIPWYIGESVRLVRRLCVHARALKLYPERYGLTREQVEKGVFHVGILADRIYDDEIRKSTETDFIKAFHPVLQPGINGDNCLKHGRQRAALERITEFEHNRITHN